MRPRENFGLAAESDEIGIRGVDYLLIELIAKEADIARLLGYRMCKS